MTEGDPSSSSSLSGTGDQSSSSATAGSPVGLGVGIKEYMNVPWMPLVDVAEAEPTGNSLDPSSDRREQSGRGFTNGVGRPGNKTSPSSSSTAAPAAAARPTDSPVTVAAPAAAGSESEEDQFPYDEVHDAQQAKTGNGSAGEEIREPVLRPKSRFRMYRMPDGSTGAGNGTSPSQPTNGSAETPASAIAAGTAERSFIIHLLPQKLMNMIEQAERYARMAFSPFMWPTKERTQRALKHFPRSVHDRLLP